MPPSPVATRAIAVAQPAGCQLHAGYQPAPDVPEPALSHALLARGKHATDLAVSDAEHLVERGSKNKNTCRHPPTRSPRPPCALKLRRITMGALPHSGFRRSRLRPLRLRRRFVRRPRRPLPAARPVARAGAGACLRLPERAGPPSRRDDGRSAGVPGARLRRGREGLPGSADLFERRLRAQPGHLASAAASARWMRRSIRAIARSSRRPSCRTGCRHGARRWSIPSWRR